MPKPADPFAGFTLSEQTSLKQPRTGRDQRLFAPPPPKPRPQPPTKPEPLQSVDAMTSKSHGVKTPRRQNVMTSPPRDITAGTGQSVPSTFDIHETPHRDFTLRTTEAEYEALDDLERELRRRFGIMASKNTLIRCGIHHIAEDLATAKEASVVIKKLTAKPVTP